MFHPCFIRGRFVVGRLVGVGRRRLPVLQCGQADDRSAVRRRPSCSRGRGYRQRGSGRWQSDSRSASSWRGIKGKPRLAGTESLHASQVDGPWLKEGSLALLVGAGAADSLLEKLQWTATPLDEASYAYVARLPGLRASADKRLAYFAKFLEHANPLIADDAFLEFAHASFDQTVQAAAGLSMADLRRWLVDPQVPPERKGFYGLALGMATGDEDRRQNEALLRRQIETPASDFRSGFDGVLGGYLLLTGSKGLDLIESRYFANPKAGPGDVRHALRALRFYHEFGRQIEPARQAEAVARVLDRPEFAAEAITDLARWQYWPIVARVAALYERREYSEPAIRRAIVGYLKACPQPVAAAALERLRGVDPKGVAEAEKILEIFSGTK